MTRRQDPKQASGWSTAEEASDSLLFESRARPDPATRYGTIADVSACVAQDLDSYVLLRWNWPVGCSQVQVVWRSHGFPSSPHDPRASHRQVTRAEYDRHGGLQLEKLAATSHYFAVFAMGQVDGELAFARSSSAGARCALHRVPSAVVSYSINRQWLRRRRIQLELRSDVEIEALPQLVLLARPGEFQPIDRNDGLVLTQLAWLRLGPSEPIRQELELPAVRTPLYLRAFFVSPASGQRYRLVDPPCEQLKVPRP